MSCGDSWPAVIGLQPKSTHGPCDEARAIGQAIEDAQGIPCPLPVIFGGKILGYTMGRGYFDQEVGWLPGLQAAFSTFDSIKTATDAGKHYRIFWHKSHSTGVTAGNWYDCWTVAGSIPGGTFTGTAYTARQLTDTDIGALWHGGSVSTATKHLVRNAISSSTGQHLFMVYDRVLTYEACSFNANANQAFTNGVAAQRYISTGDSGLQVMVTVQTTLGATASNLTQLQYTDNDGNTTQSMPTSRTVAIITGANAPTTTAGARVVAPTDTGGGTPWGPFLPLAVGDTGARALANFTTSAANTGTLTFSLVRPLAWLPTLTAGVMVDLDLTVQLACLERVYDGACLSLLLYANTSPGGTNIHGDTEVAWA